MAMSKNFRDRHSKDAALQRRKRIINSATTRVLRPKPSKPVTQKRQSNNEQKSNTNTNPRASVTATASVASNCVPRRTSRDRTIYPAPSHGRANPYKPTKQNWGHYQKDRGNTPAGITESKWDKAYNNANSWLFNRQPKEPKDTRTDVVKQAREDGSIRDFAIEFLIQKHVLSTGFIDSNP